MLWKELYEFDYFLYLKRFLSSCRTLGFHKVTECSNNILQATALLSDNYSALPKNNLWKIKVVWKIVVCSAERLFASRRLRTKPLKADSRERILFFFLSEKCPHLLLGVCVLVHRAQGILYPGQPSREAQQQADHPLQVSYEQVVPLQLHGQTALSDQHLQRRPVGHVLLNLCLQGATCFFEWTQAILDEGH